MSLFMVLVRVERMKTTQPSSRRPLQTIKDTSPKPTVSQPRQPGLRGPEGSGKSSTQPVTTAPGRFGFDASRNTDSFEPSTTRKLPTGGRSAPTGPGEETKSLDVFSRDAQLSDLLDPFKDMNLDAPGPGQRSRSDVLTSVTTIPTEDDGKNQTDQRGQQADGGTEAFGGLLALIGAVGQSGAGKVPLEVLVGAGTKTELAGAAGAVVMAGVLGVKVGTAIDGAITSALGKSLGEWVYDKANPETPATPEAPAGGQCGGDDEMPDPTSAAPRGRGSPDFSGLDAQRPTPTQLAFERSRHTSMPGDGERERPQRFAVNRGELFRGALAHHTEGRTQPIDDNTPSGGGTGSGPTTNTPPGYVDPLEADGVPGDEPPHRNA